LLRVEDLDRGRARDEVAQAQREDLRWLGVEWDAEVPPQSGRSYSVAGLPVYRCPCPRVTRVAGHCRCRYRTQESGAWRFATPLREVAFLDRAQGPQRFRPTEEPILLRADGEAAYPLAVVVDDARDGVTEVVRGGDLLEATATQILLYEALGRPTPTWLHVPVLLGADGKKLSKSHGSTELRALRAAGWTAERVWGALTPCLGMDGGRLDPAAFLPERVPAGPFVVDEAGGIVAAVVAGPG
jgi:glutamyl/glutaminyl-tRNA synthetase